MIFKILILTILLSYLYSNHLKRRRQQSVRTPKHPTPLLLPIPQELTPPSQSQFNTQFSTFHNCQPAQKILIYKWPLGLDTLKRQYDALLSGHLLSFQAEYFEKMGLGSTFQVRLLNQMGLFTTDPENLEAMLATRFSGEFFLSPASPASPAPPPNPTPHTDFGLGSRRSGLYPMIGEGILTQDSLSLLETLARNPPSPIRPHPIPKPRNLLCASRRIPRAVEVLICNPFSFASRLRLRFLFFLARDLLLLLLLLLLLPPSPLSQSEHDLSPQTFPNCTLISTLHLRLSISTSLTPPSIHPRTSRKTKNPKRRSTLCPSIHQALRDQKKNGNAASERHPFILDLYEEVRDVGLVRDQLLHVLLAGRERYHGTACLLRWTFYNLVRHPSTLKRLREEIDFGTSKDTPLSRAQIAKMSFLKCVLNETSRLHTQIPHNVRVALQTTLLPRGGGLHGTSPLLISKGTGIGFSPYLMHRSKKIYGDDANIFRAERWEGSELKLIGWGFMPFHGGPRICLGQDFALMEASHAVVRIIQNFPIFVYHLAFHYIHLFQAQRDVKFCFSKEVRDNLNALS
ncbi:hypothetical protein BGAL_0087g00100 [Botrytis galanthina]|uniref:Uncharacterized protein n=1 Tax=Botrytis galanthina TaxID=278940 RepID=A0A4S8R4Y4_9HELO|nr:hypothetical protein BGAL_0087g00100 [Botrytis galanthina]